MIVSLVLTEVKHNSANRTFHGCSGAIWWRAKAWSAWTQLMLRCNQLISGRIRCSSFRWVEKSSNEALYYRRGLWQSATRTEVWLIFDRLPDEGGWCSVNRLLKCRTCLVKKGELSQGSTLIRRMNMSQNERVRRLILPSDAFNKAADWLSSWANSGSRPGDKYALFWYAGTYP